MRWWSAIVSRPGSAVEARLRSANRNNSNNVWNVNSTGNLNNNNANNAYSAVPDCVNVNRTSLSSDI